MKFMYTFFVIILFSLQLFNYDLIIYNTYNFPIAKLEAQ